MKHKYNREVIAWRGAKHPRTGEIYKLTLEVDKDALLDWLGEKAMLSSGGAAQECRGDVRVRAKLDENKSA